MPTQELLNLDPPLSCNRCGIQPSPEHAQRFRYGVCPNCFDLTLGYCAHPDCAEHGAEHGTPIGRWELHAHAGMCPECWEENGTECASGRQCQTDVICADGSYSNPSHAMPAGAVRVHVRSRLNPDDPDTHEVNRDHYCDDCYHEMFFTCDDCGDVESQEDMFPIDDTGEHTVCRSCYESDYTRCDDCGGMFHDSECSSGLCSECYQNGNYFTCERCQERFDADDACADPDDPDSSDRYCDSCSNAIVIRRREREEQRNGSGQRPAARRNGTRYTPSGTVWRIPGTMPTPYLDGSTLPAIANYSTRVTDYYPAMGAPTDGLWFGVEDEIECSSGAISAESKAIECRSRIGREFAICKRDGSIDNGFELVTVPADLATHRERWARLLGGVPVKGIRSEKTSRTGLHIHITRAALNTFEIGKIAVFLHSDAVPGHATFIEAIAGRKLDGSTQEYAVRVRGKRVSKATKQQRNRYEILNLEPSATIEVRMFKGTLTLARVLKAIEFCHAMVYFVRQASCQALDYRSFLTWISQPAQRKAYPALVAFLRGKGYLPALLPIKSRNVSSPRAH